MIRVSERSAFWIGVVGWLALLVGAVEIARTSGSGVVLTFVVVTLVILAVNLFMRRSAAGIRTRKDRPEQ
ncbi:hypothetical protein [Nocardia sp. NPDC003963]